MLNVMVTGLLCISMLLVASSCNLCLFTVKFYWNKKKIYIYIYVSNCSCYCPSTAVSLVQNSMPLRFLCELKKFASVSSHVSSHMAILLRNFCIILLFSFMA